MNEKDPIFQETARREALIAKIVPPTRNEEPESRIAIWDIVLNYD